MKPKARSLPKLFFYIAVLLILLITLGLSIPVITPARFNELESRPTVNLGIDTCFRCGMVVSDPRFVSAYWSAVENEWRVFDDIGCMLETLKESNDTITDDLVYVSDYSSGELIKAKNAVFLVADPKKLATPMGYGIVAFKSRRDALELMDRVGGTLTDFNGLLERLLSRGSGGE